MRCRTICSLTPTLQKMTTDVLEFDVEDHEYRLNGVSAPGVTRVLGSQFPLTAPPDRIEFARKMGRAIHTACELYDRGTLDFDSVDVKVVPYLEAWIKFREQTQCTIIEVEKQVYHKQLRYCGTLDRIIELNDKRGVLDLKRPILTARVGVQTSGYAYAYNSMRPDENVTARWGLQLRADRTYRLREYKDASDFTIFLASLNLYNWRLKHE